MRSSCLVLGLYDIIGYLVYNNNYIIYAIMNALQQVSWVSSLSSKATELHQLSPTYDIFALQSL